MSSHLQTRSLTKSFDGTTVLDRLDLDIAEGSITAVVGPSGCGKTTLLRLIAGFESPDAGTITLAGRRVAGPDGEVAPHRRAVGYVAQDGALFPHLTVGQNIAYGLKGGLRSAAVREQVPITDVVVTGYSLGATHAAYLAKLDDEKKRIGFKKALMLNPPVSLYTSIKALDRLVEKHLRTDPASLRAFLDRLFEQFAGVYTQSEEVDLTDDFLFRVYLTLEPQDSELEQLIGIVFRLTANDMAFTSDVMTNAGYVVPKDAHLTQTTSCQLVSVGTNSAARAAQPYSLNGWSWMRPTPSTMTWPSPTNSPYTPPPPPSACFPLGHVANTVLSPPESRSDSA